jgi:hypothetical protein
MSMKNYTKLKYDSYKKYLKLERRLYDGWHWIFRFDNGYSVSVIKHGFSYGGRMDLFEAIQYNTYRFEEGKVFGSLSNDDVLELLKTTKELK